MSEKCRENRVKDKLRYSDKNENMRKRCKDEEEVKKKTVKAPLVKRRRGTLSKECQHQG